jgi:hypothetical protein
MPGPGDLIAYVDGQLPPDRRAEVERAIRGSWEVQAQLQAIERDVARYLEASADELPPGMPSFGKTMDAVVERLRQEPADWRERRWPRVYLHVAACILAAFGASIYFLARRSVPGVEARVVFEHAKSSEQASLRAVSQPVVHQRITARRLSGVGDRTPVSWETWNQMGTERFRERVLPVAAPGTPALLTELKQVLGANSINAREPLSPESYERWRNAGRTADSVTETRTESGETALAVTTTVAGSGAADRIVETQFVVRRSDWHPTAARLTVQAAEGVRQYELTEAAYEIQPLSPLLFPERNLTGAPPPDAPAPPLVASPRRASREELAVAQIEAQYALHKLNACTEEQIALRRDGGARIQVTGLAATDARRRQLGEALSGLRGSSLLNVEIQTVDEVTRALPATGGAPTGSGDQPRTAIRVTAGASPLELLMRARPGFDANAWNQLSADAVSLADRALAHAWALRRLAELDLEEHSAALPHDARWLLEIMVRDHLRELAGNAAQLRQLAGPVLSASGESGGPRPAEPSRQGRRSEGARWPEGGVRLVEGVQSMDSLVHALFAGADLSGQTVAWAAGKLQRGMDLLLADQGDLDAAVTGWFASPAEGVVKP